MKNIDKSRERLLFLEFIRRSRSVSSGDSVSEEAIMMMNDNN